MVDLRKIERKKLAKAEFYKRLLDRMAYISLIADISIAVATLISIHIYSAHAVLTWLNYALTIIVVVTVFVFLLFAFESRYHIKILGLIGKVGRNARRNIKK